MGGRGSYGEPLGKMPKKQKKRVNQIKEKMKIGYTVPPIKFGGNGDKVTEEPVFKKNKDGSVSFVFVGERHYHAIKSYTTGVGDTKERTERVVHKGRVMTDGLIKKDSAESTIISTKKKKK